MPEFDLHAGETVIRSVRKHWLVLLFEVLPFLILAYLPLMVPGILDFVSGTSNALEPLIAFLVGGNPWITLMLGLWWLMMWIAAFNTFTSYYLNQWIITTHRIVEIKQNGFFDRHVSSVHLNRVQDVTTEIHGIFGTLLGFGTLIVQSAGANDFFRMYGVEDPAGLRDLVMREVSALHNAQIKPTL